ncbi:hypothetical protein HDU86_006305 [Geranomyces michiganensis]|nr:hypothetical protein HDU86_006305 [Geranomyces michiganensis]
MAVSKARRTGTVADRRAAQRIWWILVRGLNGQYSLAIGHDETSVTFYQPRFLWNAADEFFPEDPKCKGIHSNMARAASRGTGQNLKPPLGPMFGVNDASAAPPNSFVAIKRCPDAAAS